MDARKKVRPTAAVRRANRRFEFHKRSQFFIRSRNETLTVVAIRVEVDKGVLVVAHGTLWR
jgi:hypothetical protein